MPRRAKSCPDCGACEKSGWGEDQYLDGVDLPEEGDFGERPLMMRGEEKDGGQRMMKWVWLWLAVLLLAGMIWMSLRGW